MQHHNNPQYHDNHANDHNDQEPVPISRQYLDRDLLAPAHTHETGGQHHYSLVVVVLVVVVLALVLQPTMCFQVMHLNAHKSEVLEGLRVKKCAFWRKFLPQLGNIFLLSFFIGGGGRGVGLVWYY